MLCPHCNITMQETTKTGILIDVCPTCRGVWLDRGELEKILSRVREVESEWEEERRPRPRQPLRDYDDDHDDNRSYGSEGRHRRKRSWTEIFDIFD